MFMTARLITTETLRLVEAHHATSEPSLMRRAGTAAASVAREMLMSGGRPLIVAGPGNNGGDAFVMACELRAGGFDPTLLFADDPEHLPPDARQARTDWLASGGQCIETYPDGKFTLIVDGLFGIGLTRAIGGRYADWVARINAAGTPVLALDMPSGLDADTGTIIGPCVRATRTATFIALKPGLFTAAGPDYAGEVTLCALGLATDDVPGGQIVVPELFMHLLSPRSHDCHKGSFGCAAIIGGASGMAGAALLAGRAALRLGAGRVYVGMLERLAVDPMQLELMLRSPDDALAMATVLAVGPGLGQSAVARELLARAIASPLSLVLDADALNLLAGDVELREVLAAQAGSVSPTSTFRLVLTPHPAEAARLLGTTTEQVQANRLVAALTLAQHYRAGVVLKGCGTVVATPAGDWYINTTGNPGLASAGSGDVLTGIITALLAQSWPPVEAMLAAVHLHGLAADVCVASGDGPVGLAASELITPARTLLNRWIDSCHTDSQRAGLV